MKTLRSKKDQQSVENLLDRLRSFVKVNEDVTFECFVEADKDLSTTAWVSEANKSISANHVKNYWFGGLGENSAKNINSAITYFML
ncbi:hypothetical protein HZS_5994 [Henneguya salminicola]|nr:hypothetical protein HZS_5994 [Henneguya salminicola]